MHGVFTLFQYPCTVLKSTVMLAITVAVARQPMTCLACETKTFVHLSCQVILRILIVYIMSMKL